MARQGPHRGEHAAIADPSAFDLVGDHPIAELGSGLSHGENLIAPSPVKGPAMTEATIPALLFSRVDRDPDSLVQFRRTASGWRGRPWREALDEIAAIARALADVGVGAGVPVAILAETRPEWVAIDLATLCLGAITVGIYPTLTADQVAYQLAHAGARVLVVENEAQWAKVRDRRGELPALAEVWSIDAVPGVPRLADRLGRPDVTWLRERAAAVRPDDVATLIYTSGTTGHPKGAILTHRNFHAVAYASREAIASRPGDRGLVFLPLAHSLQRFTVYRALLDDVQGWFVDRLDQLPDALVDARPTVLASVPRMLEKIRDRAYATAARRGRVAGAIFAWAMAAGRERALALEARRPLSLGARLRVAVADRLVLAKVRGRLGGALRTIVSGGARLDPEVARFYLGLGIEVLEGWGLTETSAPATTNREGAFVLGTVGPPLPGVELRIAGDGEVLVRGPGVFRGYHADPDATAAAFTPDGWFRTGDVGRIDEHGHLVLTDRKKEILVTAGGKNVAPVNVESRLERSPLVEKAVVIGDGRPYLVALLVADADAVAALAAQHGWPDEPVAASLTRPEIHARLEAAVAAANAELAPFEQVRRWRALPGPFGVETGELTPTLKLKRRVVAEKYADVIARLYAG